MLGLSDNMDGGPEGSVDSVPVLSPAEVAQWAIGRYSGFTRERMQVSRPVPSGKAVAMQVTNNAMAPAFPVGCYVVIDREAPTSGAPVVVDTGRGAPMLRYLIDEGAEAVLAPENPQYPVVPLGESKIIGRVIETIVRRSFL